MTGEIEPHVPERYLLDLSIEDYEAFCAARARRPADVSERDAVAREAERVRAIRLSNAGLRYDDDDPGFRGLRYVGSSIAPTAVYR